MTRASITKTTRKPAEHDRSPAIRRLLSHLARHHASTITLDDMAALVGCTPFHLIRLCRRELGITPHSLLLLVRVRRAAALIAGGEAIAHAATEVGFYDQSHFTKHFKRLQGSTPARFRIGTTSSLEQHAA